MTWFESFMKAVKPFCRQVVQAASHYIIRIRFSDSMFLSTILLFPFLKLVFFLLKSVTNIQSGLIEFFIITIILCLIVIGVRLRGYLITLLYYLLNTTTAQFVLYSCFCFEQLMNCHIGFAILIGACLSFVYVFGVFYESTFLTLSIFSHLLFMVFLVYYRLRRRLLNDEVIHFTSTPKGVLWEDALHGLDDAFHSKMSLQIGTNRIANRLSYNTAFPFFIRKREMRTAAREAVQSISEWVTPNAAQVSAILGGLATACGAFCLEGWRSGHQHREQMEAEAQRHIEQQQAEAQRHIEQQQAEAQRHIEQQQAEAQRHLEQMKARTDRSVQQERDKCFLELQRLERERARLNSLRGWLNLARAQMMHLNLQHTEETKANFEAYKKSQEELIRSIETSPTRLRPSVALNTSATSRIEGQSEAQRSQSAESLEIQTVVPPSNPFVSEANDSFLSHLI